MLVELITVKNYQKEFELKFKNFCEKAPILISFIMTQNEVLIKHENSGKTYKFKWDYEKPIKSFIHEIKEILVTNHYPKLIKSYSEEIELSVDEKCKLIEDGIALDSIPMKKNVVTEQLFVIDKVIVYKDIFIIKDMITNQAYKYKMNRSSVFFLKHYRSGNFKSLEEAGNYFFTHSELKSEIISKEE